MIEQQMSERMRDAVLDEPPLGFDPDEMVTRASRRQRHRRATTGAAAAVVAVAVSAVLVGTGRDPGQVQQGGQVADCAAGGDAGAVPVIERGMRAVLADRAPTSRFDGMPPARNGDTGEDWPQEGGDGDCVTWLFREFLASDTQTYVTLGVLQKRTELDLTGLRSRPDPAGAFPNPTVGLIGDEPQSDGSHVRTYGPAANYRVSVVHFRADGTIVVAKVESVSDTQVTVTDAQARAIATDPRLTF